MPKARWPFSNFVEIPGGMEGLGSSDPNLYPTLEHAFQALKTSDPAERAWVAAAATPGQAKWRGRRVTLRPDWIEWRVREMGLLLRFKWAAEPFRSQLLASGDEELVERTVWHDTFWGVCDCPKHQGAGRNQLGKLLMELRADFRQDPIEEG